MRRRTLRLVPALVLATLLTSCASVSGSPWPSSSRRAVPASEHPSLEDRTTELGAALDEGFRLVVFGDQRALADGEWQTLVGEIVAREQALTGALPLLAVIDTGDIVDSGQHTEQFHVLQSILAPLRAHPYLVGIGNHEVDSNRPTGARRNLADFLAPSLGADFVHDTMFYRRDLGPLRVIFLDTNDLVYGADGRREEDEQPDRRARRQLQWLVEQLAEPEGDRRTVVVAHHPFLSSSKKHSAQGAKLWRLSHEGRTLPRILLEGGVDLVLTGHTHTFERFGLSDDAGHRLQVVNVSGRPRGSFLNVGEAARRARPIAGGEKADLADRGWSGLDGFGIAQLEAMTGDDEANQWLELRVGPDGALAGQVFYLVETGGTRAGAEFVVD